MFSIFWISLFLIRHKPVWAIIIVQEWIWNCCYCLAAVQLFLLNYGLWFPNVFDLPGQTWLSPKIFLLLAPKAASLLTSLFWQLLCFLPCFKTWSDCGDEAPINLLNTRSSSPMSFNLSSRFQQSKPLKRVAHIMLNKIHYGLQSKKYFTFFNLFQTAAISLAISVHFPISLCNYNLTRNSLQFTFLFNLAPLHDNSSVQPLSLLLTPLLHVILFFSLFLHQSQSPYSSYINFSNSLVSSLCSTPLFFFFSFKNWGWARLVLGQHRMFRDEITNGLLSQIKVMPKVLYPCAWKCL